MNQPHNPTFRSYLAARAYLHDRRRLRTYRRRLAAFYLALALGYAWGVLSVCGVV